VSPTLRLAEMASPGAALLPAELGALDRLRALEEWNAAGRRPFRDGLVRALDSPLQVELPVMLPLGGWHESDLGVAHRTQEGDLVWGTSLQVIGALGLRARLDGVRLPREAELRVWGIGEEPRSFGSRPLGPEGEIWTPSVGGEILYLEVRIPARRVRAEASFRVTVSKVVELLWPTAPTPSAGLAPRGHDTCLVDARCIDASTLDVVEGFRRAVAQLRFTAGGFSGACTGALLNDTDPTTFTPYLLTANHCISTAQAAASVEAFWDFHPPACGEPDPATGSLPRSQGATLVATGAGTDFTLLRLDEIPGGRVLLGWDARPEAVPRGTVLHRISHPAPHGTILGQRYSQSVVDTEFPACGSFHRPSFLYATNTVGGTYGGSSGSPVILAGGFVVGQLAGGCGSTPDPGDGCDYDNRDFDGAFSQTFPAIASWLDPAERLSLHGGRFRLSVDWHNQFNGERGAGVPIPATDLGGYFYFTDPNNIELMVKMLDFGEHVLFFYGQLTNLEFTITVTDTVTGSARSYSNGPDDCGDIDPEAFPGAGGASLSENRWRWAEMPAAGAEGVGQPSGAEGALARPRAPGFQRTAREPRGEAPAVMQAAGTCSPGAHRLCLLGSRIAAELTWRNQFNEHSGVGLAEPMSDLTGSFAFDDPANLELLVKALDFGDRILVIWGSLSNLEYTLRVTETASGAVNNYHNSAGTYCGGLDEHAF
jgi:hypothetical protein